MSESESTNRVTPQEFAGTAEPVGVHGHKPWFQGTMIAGRQIVEETGELPTRAKLAERQGIKVEDMRRMLRLAREPVSLSASIGGEDDKTVDELLADHGSSRPEEELQHADLTRQIERALKALTLNEREVIKLRYGLGEDAGRTLDELGKRFKLTRERIGQIEISALRKLKHPAVSRLLRTFLDA